MLSIDTAPAYGEGPPRAVTCEDPSFRSFLGAALAGHSPPSAFGAEPVVERLRACLDVSQYIGGLDSVDHPVVESRAEPHHLGDLDQGVADDGPVRRPPHAERDRGAAHRVEAVHGPVPQ